MSNFRLKNFANVFINGDVYSLCGNKQKGTASIVCGLSKRKETPKYMIKINTKENAEKRFENEIKFLKEYNGEGVVKIIAEGYIEYKAGNGIEKYRYYVMEKLLPFPELMKRDFPLLQKLKYYLQLCKSVQCIHALNIIHRDIKPDNILFDEARQKVVLCDFGIAKYPDSNITKAEDRLANANYAAPEQRGKGGIITKGTDLYPLGLILNEYLTGFLPLGSNHYRIIEKYPYLGELDEIVSKMTYGDNRLREQDIGVVIFELQQILSKFDHFKKAGRKQLLVGKNNKRNREITEMFLNDYYAIIYMCNSNIDIGKLNVYYHSNIHCCIASENIRGEIILAKIEDVVRKKFEYESGTPNVYEMKNEWKLCSKAQFNEMIAFIKPYDHLKLQSSFKILHYFGMLRDYHAEEVLDKIKTEVDELNKLMDDAPIIYLLKMIKELIPDAFFNSKGICIIPIFDKSRIQIEEDSIFLERDLILISLRKRIEKTLQNTTTIFDESGYKLVFNKTKDFYILSKMCRAYADRLPEGDVKRIDIEDMLTGVILVKRKKVMILDRYSVEYILSKII